MFVYKETQLTINDRKWLNQYIFAVQNCFSILQLYILKSGNPFYINNIRILVFENSFHGELIYLI